ncbi:hypothetical protein PENSPDRAFT_119959 [Peniophora sp. CONT]|nr:hypothetical protein PENSPDRAFT_119959 [Peniophora sp. CONT]
MSTTRRRTSISQLLNPVSPQPQPRAPSPGPSVVRQPQPDRQPPQQSGPPGSYFSHAHSGYAPAPGYPYPYPVYPDPSWQAPYCILPPHYYPGPQPPPPTPNSEQPSPAQTRAPTPTGHPSTPRQDYYRGEPPPHFPPPPPGYPVYGAPPGLMSTQS